MNHYNYHVTFENPKGEVMERLVEADNPGHAFHLCLKKFKVKNLIKCSIENRRTGFWVEYDPPKNWDMPAPQRHKSSDVQLEINL